MCMSLLWYYRPENLDCGQRAFDTPDEIYVSQHRDHTSVACIEDKWYVMTFKWNQYGIFRKRFFVLVLTKKLYKSCGSIVILFRKKDIRRGGLLLLH